MKTASQIGDFLQSTGEVFADVEGGSIALPATATQELKDKWKAHARAELFQRKVGDLYSRFGSEKTWAELNEASPPDLEDRPTYEQPKTQQLRQQTAPGVASTPAMLSADGLALQGSQTAGNSKTVSASSEKQEPSAVNIAEVLAETEHARAARQAAMRARFQNEL